MNREGPLNSTTNEIQLSEITLAQEIVWKFKPVIIVISEIILKSDGKVSKSIILISVMMPGVINSYMNLAMIQTSLSLNSILITLRTLSSHMIWLITWHRYVCAE